MCVCGCVREIEEQDETSDCLSIRMGRAWFNQDTHLNPISAGMNELTSREQYRWTQEKRNSCESLLSDDGVRCSVLEEREEDATTLASQSSTA